MKRLIKLIVGVALTLLVIGLAYGSRCRLRTKSTERRAQRVLAAIPDTVDSATANAEIRQRKNDTKAGQYQPVVPGAAVVSSPPVLSTAETVKRCVAYNPLWWQVSMATLLLVGALVTWRFARSNRTEP